MDYVVLLTPLVGLLLALVGLVCLASHAGAPYLTWGLFCFPAGCFLLSNTFNDWLDGVWQRHRTH